MPGATSYYNQPNHKFSTHKFEAPHKGTSIIAREWPIAWVGIDGDANVDKEGAP